MINIVVWLLRENGEEERVNMEAFSDSLYVLRTDRPDGSTDYRGVHNPRETAQLDYASGALRCSSFRITDHVAYEEDAVPIERDESLQDRALREFIETVYA